MQNLYIKDLGIKYLAECLRRYNGITGYLILFFLFVVFIYMHGSEREKKMFVPLSIIMVLTVFNPVFPVIIAKVVDVSNEYYRFIWVAPVIVLVPYMFTKAIIYLSKGKQNKWIPVVLIAFIIISSVNTTYIKNIQFADNVYKMPDELIKISEIIHNDCVDEYPKAFFDYQYNMMVRQYDPKMLLTIDREDYIYAASNEFSTDMIYDDTHPENRILAALFRYQNVDTGSLLAALEGTKTEYIVLENGSTNIEKLKNMGLVEVSSTETRTILKYNLVERRPFELVDYSEVYRNGW